MKILVKVLRDDRTQDLSVELVAGERGLARQIENPRVQKPGLALAGYLPAVRPGHVQVMGNTEMDYLDSLSDDARVDAIDRLCGSSLACVVVTQGRQVPPQMLASAERCGIAIFQTSLPTETFMNRAHNLLDEYLSPEVTRHGVVVDVFGVGLLLSGKSGVGKSECALDLVLRGHRLVADDVVIIRLVGQQLIGMGSPLTRHHMEVRGLGIINVQDLFGAASVREKKKIELVVEMADWQPETEYDRLGLDEEHEPILDIAVPKIRLPIRPGRNVASIVEVAARNHLLKLQGYHAAREFKEALERRLAASAERMPAAEAE